MGNKTKAVIFDMYETLVTMCQSVPYKGADIAADLGLAETVFREVWDASGDDRTLGVRSFEEVIRLSMKVNAINSEPLLQEILRKRDVFQKDCFKHLHPEILPMLKGLKERNIKIALISNCYPEERDVIKQSVLWEYFDVVCLSCEMGLQKPQREIFEACLEKLGQKLEQKSGQEPWNESGQDLGTPSLKPCECLYVGDGGSRELEKARELGMKAVQAAWYLGEGLDQPVGRLHEFEQIETPLDILKITDKKKAVFIGLTGIDYVYYLDAMPEENSKCKTGEYAKYVGGPAANAAITYAALGGDATLITAYGNSVESRTITEELTSYGVKVINVSKDDALPGISTICITGEGKRTIISGQKQYAQIDLSGIEQSGIGQSCIDLSDYDLALFDCNQQDVSLPLLERVSCDVVLDAGSYKPNVEKFLEKATIVISSEQFRDAGGKDIFTMDYKNITMRAMTRGEKSILTPGGEIEVAPANCVDSLAAGDIFHGAFCYAYVEREETFEQALRFASKVAGESVKYKGPRAWIKGERDGR